MERFNALQAQFILLWKDIFTNSEILYIVLAPRVSDQKCMPHWMLIICVDPDHLLRTKMEAKIEDILVAKQIEFMADSDAE